MKHYTNNAYRFGVIWRELCDAFNGALLAFPRASHSVMSTINRDLCFWCVVPIQQYGLARRTMTRMETSRRIDFLYQIVIHIFPTSE
jgi:hypothetical protein